MTQGLNSTATRRMTVSRLQPLITRVQERCALLSAPKLLWTAGGVAALCAGGWLGFWAVDDLGAKTGDSERARQAPVPLLESLVTGESAEPGALAPVPPGPAQLVEVTARFDALLGPSVEMKSLAQPCDFRGRPARTAHSGWGLGLSLARSWTFCVFPGYGAPRLNDSAWHALEGDAGSPDAAAWLLPLPESLANPVPGYLFVAAVGQCDSAGRCSASVQGGSVTDPEFLSTALPRARGVQYFSATEPQRPAEGDEDDELEELDMAGDVSPAELESSAAPGGDAPGSASEPPEAASTARVVQW